MTRRKKLIEVALPLEAINKESAREKSIRHGHPSTLHLWWARRPLAACRAVLFAQFIDDPESDPAYRDEDGRVDEERAGLKRAQLFNLIEELVKWENTNNDRVINAARAEIARCVASHLIEEGALQKDTIICGEGEGEPHSKGPLSGEFRTAWDLIVYGHGDLEALDNRTKRLCPPDVVNHFLVTYAPPVLDPFAGGGSIPLEAQRLGLRAHASDLNPVAVVINKALVEIPTTFAGRRPVNPEASERLGTAQHRSAHGLVEDVCYYGTWLRDEAAKRIGSHYPRVLVTAEMTKDRPDLKAYVGQEITVIAWLWARTVASTDPSLRGAHVPLVASFWLSKKKGKEAYVEPIPNRENGTYEFRVRTGLPKDRFDPSKGTTARTGARCLLTDVSLPFDHIREEGKAGRLLTRLMAIACEGSRGRVYIDPLPEHEQAAREVMADDYPITDLPQQALGFRVQLYGMNQHWKLFTKRQLRALVTFSDLVEEVRHKVLADAKSGGRLDDDRGLAEGGAGPRSYADAVATYLSLVVSRLSNYSSTNCSWSSHAKDQMVKQVFARQALPMIWDYAESNPFSDAGGTFESHLKFTCNAIPQITSAAPVVVRQQSAMDPATYAGEVVSTDPPYYDNIGYADLSDFFYVWLRRSLRGIYPQLFATMLTPKSLEMIATPFRHDGSTERAAAFFEEGLGSAIGLWRTAGCSGYPTSIFYAFKQAETDVSGTASTGWETFLGGILRHGFCITGTWPIRTELTGNLKKQVAALASSVVLVCAPRDLNATMATRREFLTSLKQELPDALNKLQSGNIAPVDLAQAAIGPGMAVFSRYSKVVESDGSSMPVRTALTLINQVLDEVLTEQEGEFDGDTRWAVSWFEQAGVQDGPYGVAETLSKAKNTSVQGLVEAGVISARGGKVKLLAREEMPSDWDPATDNRFTVWEATQHLIRRLENEGELAAAELLSRLGADAGEMARDLAYRLYSICERKKWADEALAYNGLVIAWPELSRLAMQERKTVAVADAGLFESET